VTSRIAEWVIGVVLGEPGTVAVADDLVRRSLLIPAGVDANLPPEPLGTWPAILPTASFRYCGTPGGNSMHPPADGERW
jgi:hypothetical protein